MIEYNEEDLRSGFCVWSGFFLLQFQISFISIFWVRLFYFSWYLHFIILMYAISLLCTSVLWNNMGALDLYWYVDSLVLLEFYQRSLGVWLWKRFHFIIYKCTSHWILGFILFYESEIGKCIVRASLSYWYLGFFTSDDGESSYFGLNEFMFLCNQRRNVGWHYHRFWYNTNDTSLCQRSITKYGFGVGNVMAEKEESILRIFIFIIKRWSQVSVLNKMAVGNDLWTKNINEINDLDCMLICKAQLREYMFTRWANGFFKRYICFFKRYTFFGGFHHIHQYNSSEQLTRYFFMRVLSWNCRGMGSKWNISYLREIWYKHKPDFLFL